jgi:lipoate-protein ligase A
MRFLSLTLPDFPANLALDEALLLEAEEGHPGEILRLWEWPTPAVVLGAAGILAEDVREENCSNDAIPIGRRSSGGGTVLLGQGSLNYSLVLSYERAEELTQISSSYRFILGRIRDVLRPLVPGIELSGTSDLTIDGKKFSGNSQQRKRSHLLHHGTLLYQFDLAQIGRYLNQPRRQPEYRQDREHDAFLRNLLVSREMLGERLRSAWQADEESGPWPAERVRQLNTDKYCREDWVHRR